MNTQAACEEVLALNQSPRRLEVRWGGVGGGGGIQVRDHSPNTVTSPE